MTTPTTPAAARAIRRDLMTRRDAALAAGNIAEFQRLTTAIAALPLAGMPALTARDIARYARDGR